MRHRVFAAIVIFAAMLIISTANAAVIRIRIAYHEMVNEVRPIPSSYVTRQTILVTLHDQHLASEHREWQSGNQHGLVDSDGAIGTPTKAGAYDLSWHVSGANTLVRYKYGAQHVEKLTVRVAGASCAASISKTLKPGFTEFLRFGSSNDAHYSKSIIPTVDSCEIE